MLQTQRLRQTRVRNPRGQGERLRTEIIDAASALLAESGDPSQLSLRSVARRAGIAATSVYLHFQDIEHLTATVAERDFAELGRAIGRAHRTSDDPVLALIAGCKAYCGFGLRHPGEYRVLFEVIRPDLAPTMEYTLEQSAGRRVLEALTNAIRSCQQLSGAAQDADPQRLAVLVWAALHGIVSLRLARPRFPWPGLDQMVEETTRRLLGV